MKNGQTEIVTIAVDKSKKKAFLEMLKLFDFVKIESPNEFISRYIKTAPKKNLLSEKEILAEISQNRSQKK